MSGLIGKRSGWPIFDEKGKNIPVPWLKQVPVSLPKSEPQRLIWYEALQLGFDDKRRSFKGHAKKQELLRSVKVVNLKDGREHKLGDTITVEHFIEIRRYCRSFKVRIPRLLSVTVWWCGTPTHGQYNRLRAPGSIGAASLSSQF